MVDGAALACQVLREAWAAQDLKVVKRQAHTMKANCAMVGAARLAADCSRLERLLPDLGGAVRDGVQGLLLSVSQRYEALADNLAQWRQRVQTAGG
ncbi:MAG: hybrid sensor histidine kinase/response regulator [Nevskia sp.]|nr:hybrid sensor histidine kinase/response regulator [Nevskia sp.]